MYGSKKKRYDKNGNEISEELYQTMVKDGLIEERRKKPEPKEELGIFSTLRNFLGAKEEKKSKESPIPSSATSTRSEEELKELRKKDPRWYLRKK